LDRWSDCHRVGDIELLRAPIGDGKPTTTYILSVFEKPHWRTVLTTKDKEKEKEKAFALAKEIDDKVRVARRSRRSRRSAKIVRK
jgi:hypothetical protein